LNLLDEGAFIATYKHAVPLGLIDLCMEHSSSDGAKKDQIHAFALVLDPECSGCGELVAWRNRLELAVGDLKEESHARWEDLAGRLIRWQV
jgi:hypothetical protein